MHAKRNRKPHHPHAGRPLAWALRERIAALRRSGASLRAIAAAAGVAVNTVRRYSSQIDKQV
jgi:lambda repressor-like predicted transcriptional regulator